MAASLPQWTPWLWRRPGDVRAVKRARSTLRIIYRDLEAAHEAAAKAGGAGGGPPRKRGGKNKA